MYRLCMKQGLRACAALFAVVCGASQVSPAPASVAMLPPEEIVIEMHSGLGIPGTFTSEGVVSDSGSVTVDFVHATALPAPVVGTAHYIRTFHGSEGTLTIRVQTIIQPTEVPWIWIETGHWVVLDGTGAFEGLRGTGDEAGTRDFAANTLDAKFTGRLH